VGLIVQAAAMDRVRAEVRLLEEVLDGISVMLTNPVAATDGSLIPAGDATVRELVRSTGTLVDDLDAAPAAKGSLLTLSGRALGVLGRDAIDDEQAQALTERGLALLRDSLGSEHHHTLRGQRDLVLRLARAGEDERAAELLRETWRTHEAGTADPRLRLQLAGLAFKLDVALSADTRLSELLRRTLHEATATLGPADQSMLSRRTWLTWAVPPTEALRTLELARSRLGPLDPGAENARACLELVEEARANHDDAPPGPTPTARASAADPGS